MKFGYTILYVADVEQTITFYESAFGFQRKFITPEGDYGELLTGETTLAFASFELGESNFKKGYLKSNPADRPFGMELAFVTDDIETDYQRAVDAGAVIEEPIIAKPWGQKVGYVRDINGFLIEICTPVNPS